MCCQLGEIVLKGRLVEVRIVVVLLPNRSLDREYIACSTLFPLIFQGWEYDQCSNMIVVRAKIGLRKYWFPAILGVR